MTDVDELTAWLRAQLDEDERVALAASRSVADHHYAPADVEQAHVAAGGRWQSKPWLYHAKVAAEDVREYWRDEGPQVTEMVWAEVAAHVALHEPARVLREVEAKRRLIDEWEDPAEVENLPEGVQDGRDWNERDEQVAVAHAIDHIVRLLALPYADRPGYREEWRP